MTQPGADALVVAAEALREAQAAANRVGHLLDQATAQLEDHLVTPVRMSGSGADQMSDLAVTRWILAETYRDLHDARRQFRQMDNRTNDGHSWLPLAMGAQHRRVASTDHRSDGGALRAFAMACAEAREAGLGVDRGISRVVANLKAAVVMVDGLYPGSTCEDIDTGRLRRRLISLQRDMETVRALIERACERLGVQVGQARQSLPGPVRDRIALEATLPPVRS